MYSHEQLYIHICMQKHNDSIKTSGHRSWEQYTSHFIRKGCVWEGVGDWTELQHIDPPNSSGTAFLSRSPGLLNRGPRGPASAGTWFSFQHLSPTVLNFLSPGLYNNLTSTYFLRASQFALDSQGCPSTVKVAPDLLDRQGRPSTVKVAPDLLISSSGCTCYLHRCISSFDSLAGSEVNMQHLNPKTFSKSDKKIISAIIN